MANLVLSRGRVRAGDQSGDGGAAPAHRRSAEIAGVRAVHGDRLRGAPVPHARSGLDERSREHARGGCARLVSDAGMRPTTRSWWWWAMSTAEEVFALAEKYFGPIAARPLPARKPQDEPPQRGIRRITSRRRPSCRTCSWAVAHPVCATSRRTGSPTRWRCWRACWTASEAARLNRALVRESRMASASAPATTASTAVPGMFIVDGDPRAGQDRAELEQALRARSAHRRARRDRRGTEARQGAGRACQVFQRDSMFSQARTSARSKMPAVRTTRWICRSAS